MTLCKGLIQSENTLLKDELVVYLESHVTDNGKVSAWISYNQNPVEKIESNHVDQIQKVRFSMFCQTGVSRICHKTHQASNSPMKNFPHTD